MENSDKPAFTTVGYGEQGTYLQEGLTKREYFASKAMQGFLSYGKMHISKIPNESIILADELLKQLEQ